VRLAFTRRTDYAIRAALELARAGRRSATHVEVAVATGAPPAVVKQALADLARAGLATATRGRRGGYLLARSPSSISVFDVVRALEPVGLAEQHCVLHEGTCLARAACPFHATIASARQAFIAALERDTLTDVLERGADPRESRQAR
jgi:Rrf2 family protein